MSSVRLVYEARGQSTCLTGSEEAEQARAIAQCHLLVDHSSNAGQARLQLGISSFWVKLTRMMSNEKASCCLPSYCFNPLC